MSVSDIDFEPVARAGAEAWNAQLGYPSPNWDDASEEFRSTFRRVAAAIIDEIARQAV